jgi:hypothetical protein
MNAIYLGDGVYAKFEPEACELTLWTDRQENGRNWLVLGPAEQSNLIVWMQRTPGTELGPIGKVPSDG